MTERAANTLMRAARLHVVLGTLGRLLLVLAALSVPPALAAWSQASHELALRLAVTASVLVLVGWPVSRLRPLNTGENDIQWNEALAVTGLAFLIAALVMVWPLTGAGLSGIDAMLEATSGITTTGLTVLRGLDQTDPAMLFLRAWMQWYGGLGIAVLTVALIMRHHASARRLLETTGEQLTDAGARGHARRVFAVYLALTLIGIAAVWMTGLAPVDALLYALPAVATGGFAPSDQSLAGLPAATIATLSLITVASAISLPLYARLPHRGLRSLRHEPELIALLGAILITALLLSAIASLSIGLPWPQALAQGFALGVSAQTDTGFSTTEVADLPATSQVVLMISMSIGGCTGSTAGGIKLIRLLIIMRLVQLALRRTAIAERAVLQAQVGGARIEPSMVTATLQLMAFWAMVLLASWLAFLAFGQPPLASLFEVVSATANAGLSVGLTSPELPPALKLVLCADMLFGRVEVLALLVVLYPPTWLARKRNP
ncbi:MAG: potassium transporter TrkG [Lamprobacter sp.]|uniref:TrkH family potassium uptake protein n=1 Tax=Lamprobacter sp. TaxID=3100796 RepID=UPI002B2637E1|nr:potassium transporter TrkG [Lamprobacter sp.]MEA3642253.1 potassium transporter TrkG [Lamprobacter sp.]